MIDNELPASALEFTATCWPSEVALEPTALIEAALDALIQLDSIGRILYWSGGASRTFGWTAEEAQTKPVAELLSTRAGPITRALATARQTGSFEGLLPALHKSGECLVIHCRVTVLNPAEHTVTSFALVARDVTAQKNLEARYLRAQTAEVSVLAGGMSHELNNILAPILMVIPMLAWEQDAGEFKEKLDMLASCAERGREIIRQLLSFGREGSDSALIHLQRLIRDTVALAAQAFPPAIHIERRIAPDLAPVFGNAAELSRLLINLMINARDAIPGGGILSVTAQNVDLDAAGAATHSAKPGPYILIEISDTGCGFSAAQIQTMFDCVRTTRDPLHEPGAVMQRASAIARAHGGFIRGRSELGWGSAFSVYLPAHSTTCAPPAHPLAGDTRQASGVWTSAGASEKED